jgi:hypothetical protein
LNFKLKLKLKFNFRVGTIFRRTEKIGANFKLNFNFKLKLKFNFNFRVSTIFRRLAPKRTRRADSRPLKQPLEEVRTLCYK